MRAVSIVVMGLAAACHAAAADPVRDAARVISTGGILGHIQTLASDAYEGRAPGTDGETLSVAYISAQMKQLGLKPGNPNGSYVQAVPVLGTVAQATFQYRFGNTITALTFPQDFVASSDQQLANVKLDQSPLVFVGYGVVAPEYGWDDYKGVDVRGKTIVMLINDPPVPDPHDPAKLDPAMFKGAAMTYYGRWTYKFEMAAKLGAAAAIIVHETKPAGYPYDVIRQSGSGEHFVLADEASSAGAPITAWINAERAADLFGAAGLDFAKLKEAARRKDFQPLALGGQASFTIKNNWRKLATSNVVGLVEGSDPQLRQQVVIYSAHWDHLGVNPALPGPRGAQTFHGALDNAAGVSAILEIAKAYQALPTPPKRSILFLATTLEEVGLLGARYYTRHPLFPLDQTLADINIDGLNAWGPTAQIENVTSGHSSLDGILSRLAMAQGRHAELDSRPELGNFYRADQLEFARVGVPVIFTKSRSKYVGQPDSYAREHVDRYIRDDYHHVSDDVRSDWDFSGAVQDLALLFGLGYEVAQGAAFPAWLDGSEFKARRGGAASAGQK